MGETQAPGLEIIRKKGGIVENTVGRIGSIETNLLLGTPQAILQNPSEETAQLLRERFKDVEWNGNVEVYLGHSPFWRQMKRLFSKERRSNIFLRVVEGIPTTIGASLAGKLFRADGYNPWTESAQVYHSNQAVGAHEIGHAMDFDQAKHPGLRALLYGLPILREKLEWNASHNAMKQLTDPEKEAARKVLEPAFGTYVGSEIMSVGQLLKVPFAPVRLAFGAASVLAGHVHARLFKHNMFFDKEKKMTIPKSPQLAGV